MFITRSSSLNREWNSRFIAHHGLLAHRVVTLGGFNGQPISLQDHTFQVNIAVAQSQVVIATASDLELQHPQVLTWGQSTPGTHRPCLSEKAVHSLGPVRSWCMACWDVACRPEITSGLVGSWMRHPLLAHLLIRQKCLFGKGTCGSSCWWPCSYGPDIVQGIFHIGEADNAPHWAGHQGHSHKHWQSPEGNEDPQADGQTSARTTASSCWRWCESNRTVQTPFGPRFLPP